MLKIFYGMLHTCLVFSLLQLQLDYQSVNPKGWFGYILEVRIDYPVSLEYPGIGTLKPVFRIAPVLVSTECEAESLRTRQSGRKGRLWHVLNYGPYYIMLVPDLDIEKWRVVSKNKIILYQDHGRHSSCFMFALVTGSVHCFDFTRCVSGCLKSSERK